MLGWIFFKLHWGGVSKTKCWGGGSKSSIGYRAPFESKKNGADAIKTESITDGIFLRVAPEKSRSFIARSHWIDGWRYKTFLNSAQNKSFADAI